MKNSINREQRQACLSFVERENFRPQVKRKLLSLLVLLMTVSGNGGTINNSYYSTNHGTAQGKQAFTITAGEGVAALDIDATATTFNKATSTLTMGNADAVVSAMVLEALSGEGTAESPYLIQSDDDWLYFCQNFDTYRTAVVKLSTNVTITTPLGTSATPFTGTFDGNGNTMNANITDTSAQGTAPFRYIQGATIRNLVVTGSVTGTTHTSGLVGFTSGDANTQNTIENCLVQATVTGNAHFGGFVGHGLNSKVVITGCAFTGLLATSSQYVGGLLGWCGNATVAITNSIFAGTKTGNAKFHPIGIFYGGSSNVSGCGNCYYTIAGTTSEFVRYAGKQAFTITAGEGVAALDIDATATTYNVSGITVYEEMPGMTFGGNIYAGNGDEVQLDLTVDASIASDPNLEYLSTSGIFNKATSTLTMGNADVVVSAMVFEALSGEGTAESPYLIQSDVDWTNFCTNFNQYKASVIKLTGNINATAIAGTSDIPFTGTFDGQGHTLTFNWTSTGEYCAPFRSINGATFNNLHVTGTINTSHRRTGGLIGQSFGTSYINNCRSSVKFISSYSGDAIRGGFASSIGGGTLNINGCVFDGTFTGAASQTWGGFVGWKYNYTVNIVNSLFVPNSVNVSATYSSMLLSK